MHVRARPVIHLSGVPGRPAAVAAMFVQSSDLFFAPKAAGIALFDAAGQCKAT